MGALTVEAPAGSTIGTLILGEWSTKCALGRSGIVTAKREGDGGTPAGLFPLRCVYYRHDRRSVPETILNPFRSSATLAGAMTRQIRITITGWSCFPPNSA